MWDLRLPAQPSRVGQLVRRGFLPSPTHGGEGITRLRIVGDRAYLLDRNMVRVIDIADPTAPRELGLFRLWMSIDDLVVQGTTLYLATNDRALGLVAVDASDPARPVQVSYTADGSYRRLVLAGADLLAIGDLSGGGSGQNGVRTFDLTDPFAPRPVADSMVIRFPAYDLAFQAPYLYAAWNDGLHVYDLGDPVNVREVALFPTVEPVNAVDIDNGVAYLTHGGIVEQVDLADPAQPRSLGTVAVEPMRGDAGDASIAAGVGLAVVVQRSSGIIRVLDTGDARQMKELARLDSELPVVGRIAVGSGSGSGYAYVPMPDGLHIVDVSVPASPAVVGAYTLPGPSGSSRVRDLTARGATLQLLVDVDNDHHELQVLDLTVPTSPRHIATVNLGNGIGGGLRVRGGIAYVAAYHYDRDKSTARRLLQVVDLGGPGAPRLVGTAEVAGATPSGEGYPQLALLGNNVLLGLSRGLAVVDVSNPAQPELKGRLDIPNGLDTMAVTTAAAHGYIAHRENASSRLRWMIGTVDIADATAPQLVGSTEPSWVANSLVSSANHLFTGTPAGMQKFGYIRSGDLNRLGSLPLPAAVKSIVHADGHAYVADGDGGLFIVYTGDDDLPEAVPPPQTPPLPTTTPPTTPSAPPPPTATSPSVPPSPTTNNPAPTSTSPTPTPGPEARVCPQILTLVPRQVLNAALANPDWVQGWNRLQNPSVPPGPFNQRRRWLSILTLNVPFDLLFNPVLYKASCP